MLTQWLRLDPRVDVGEYLEVATVVEVRVVPCFVHGEAQLSDSPGRSRVQREVREVRERLSVPIRERGLEELARVPGVVEAERGATVAQESFDPRQVGFFGADVEPVPAALGSDPLGHGAEHVAQPRHRNLERGFRMLRTIVLAPDRFDEGRGRDDAVGAKQQGDEQRALARRDDTFDFAVVEYDGYIAQYPKEH